MRIHDLSHVRPFETPVDIAEPFQAISEASLRQIVETVSIPRHYLAENENNSRIGQWIFQQVRSYGYHVSFQGTCQNIIALPELCHSPVLLVATHYDTVPGSPGADDNGSGIAVLLTCARVLSACCSPVSTIFVVFNREEDSLLGSQEFVKEYLPRTDLTIAAAHVLEMVGYCSHEAGSQHLPSGLPVKIPDTGDFLGLVGNQRSTSLVTSVLRTARTYLTEFPVVGLSVYLGLEKYFPHLQRSDHAPFWHANIPALMWTDTAEFRNRRYHSPQDTPETLDYTFMRQVAQLLLGTILLHERERAV